MVQKEKTKQKIIARNPFEKYKFKIGSVGNANFN